MQATCYKYIPSEAGLWTVGFYDPSGKWIAESDHDIREDAAIRAAWLNGAGTAKEQEMASELLAVRGAARYLLARAKAAHGKSNGVAWKRAISEMEEALA